MIDMSALRPRKNCCISARVTAWSYTMLHRHRVCQIYFRHPQHQKSTVLANASVMLPHAGMFSHPPPSRVQDVLQTTSLHLAACSSHRKTTPTSRRQSVSEQHRLPTSPSVSSSHTLPPDGRCSSSALAADQIASSPAVSLSMTPSSSTAATDMIIVHGAGSFGHHQAHLHGVSRGPLTDPYVRAGFVATRYARDLNPLACACKQMTIQHARIYREQF